MVNDEIYKIKSIEIDFDLNLVTLNYAIDLESSSSSKSSSRRKSNSISSSSNATSNTNATNETDELAIQIDASKLTFNCLHV